MPSGRVSPGLPGFGMCTRRNGWGRYVPACNCPASSSRKARTDSTPPASIVGDAHAVDSGSALVGGHVNPRPPHHVAAGDLVEEGVEPTCPVLLGTAVEHALQSSNGIQAIGLSDGPSRHLGTHQRPSLPRHASMKQGPFARDRLCCPARRHYYDPLRLPLGRRPLPGVTGYRQSTLPTPAGSGPRRASPVPTTTF